MKEILEIRLEWKLFQDDGLTIDEYNRAKDYYYESYNNAINFVKGIKLWSNSIKKIIITNNYYEDVQQQANEWGFSVEFAKHKEYIGISRCLSNKSNDNLEYYIFFPVWLTPSDDIFWRSSIFYQLIYPYCEQLFPKELEKWKHSPSYYNIYDYLKYSVASWGPAIRASKLLKHHLGEVPNTLTSEQLYNFFARRLKKHLFDYNSEGDNSRNLSRFWDEFYITFSNFVLRGLQTKFNKGELQFTDRKLSDLVNVIISEIDFLEENLTKESNHSLDSLLSTVLNFFSYFNIEIKDYKKQESFYIHLPKNPKEYFKGNLVDTEPRIVCFMDILGFSEMIDEYENDDISTVLQDIQKAFEKAMSILKTHIQDNPNDQIKFLEHKTFSDNICISLPFFNTEKDFLANLSLIFTFIRALQFSLMSLGFFTRGGVAIGPYYSDENMIFSKAMVSAYYLESRKAKYPRILIDESIINRIKDYDFESIKYYNLDKAILLERGLSIVNPFELFSDIKQLTESIFNPSKLYEGLPDFSKSLLDNIKDLKISPIKTFSNYETDSIDRILTMVNEKISLYRLKKNICIKYLWLKTLVIWIKYKQPSSRFAYISKLFKE